MKKMKKAIFSFIGLTKESGKNMTPSEKHFAEFDKKARYFGIEKIIPLVPVSPEVIKAALASGDEPLNTIPLIKWDKAAGCRMTKSGYVDDYKAAPGHLFYRSSIANSLCDRVCILKHVARHYLGEGMPI